MARPGAVIIGAGALGLGFLAERMAADYGLCLVDVAGREPFLTRLAGEQGFTMSLCRPGRVEVQRVDGSFTTATIGGVHSAGSLVRALTEAELVLTAVGTRALPDVVKAVAPTLNARRRPVWLLFCENGLHIAARYGRGLNAPVVCMDTVMSRMCRFAGPAETAYVPLWPGAGERLVAESYDAIPLDRTLCGDGPFTPVFQLMDRDEFGMWEDIKLFLHNGLHAFLAYHGFLEGTERFPGISSPVLAEALRVMREEIVPAILFHHPSSPRAMLEEYGRKLLGRLVDPLFNDTIERGIRGAEEKLAPGERLLGGRDYIREAGIEPRGYATTIEAARRIAGMMGKR